MKRYALLLGMLLTVGSGYTAQVAVSSVGASGRGEAGPAPASGLTSSLAKRTGRSVVTGQLAPAETRGRCKAR